MKRLPILGAVLTLTISGAIAQVDSVAIAEELNAAWENAQANASRPGDDALSCDQLQTELDSLVNDTTVQQKLASLETRAKEEIARAQATKQAGMAALAGRAVLGAAVSGNQWATYINLFAGYVQTAILTLQANAAAPRARAMRDDVLSMMPQFARTAQVADIAQGQNCAFMRPAQP